MSPNHRTERPIHRVRVRSLLATCTAALCFSVDCIAHDQQGSNGGSANAPYIEELEAAQRDLLDAVRRDMASLPLLPAWRKDEDPALKKQRDVRRKLARRLEELEARVNAETAIRTRYVSAYSSNGAWLAYYSRLADRIEELGNRNLPKDGTISLHGTVVILLTLGPSGSIESIEVVHSSLEKLTSHAIGILRRLQPFEAFPAALAGSVDRIVVGTQFNYEGA